LPPASPDAFQTFSKPHAGYLHLTISCPVFALILQHEPGYQHLLPEDFSPESRVWIYQSSRLFSLSEALEIEERLADFARPGLHTALVSKGYGNFFSGVSLC
jgi:hypothetical protein